MEILKPISQESERKSTLPCRPQSFLQSSLLKSKTVDVFIKHEYTEGASDA